MKNSLSLLLFFLSLIQLNGQITSEEAMKKLDFLTGSWQGIANTSIPSGPINGIQQHELVEYRLGGSILLIEGRGFFEEELVFNALAIISFDEKKQEYEMKSWLSTGETTTAYLKEIEDKKWEWGFEVPMGKIKYVISINEKGQWVEEGSFSPGGDTWFPSFNMVLDKIQ